jgi:hypothetical protein
MNWTEQQECEGCEQHPLAVTTAVYLIFRDAAVVSIDSSLSSPSNSVSLSVD